jgi:DNA polymerase III epsilon subunit-like protein
MGLDLLGRPHVLTPLYVLRDVLLQLLVLQLPSVPVRRERVVGMLRESYRLDEIANERGLDIAQPGHLDLADAVLEHKLGDLLKLRGSELVLRHLAHSFVLAANFKG